MSTLKNYYIEGDRIKLFSHHGAMVPFTREMMEEIRMYKVVETCMFFNQELAVNVRKRRRVNFEMTYESRFFVEHEKLEELEDGLPEGVEELMLGFHFDKKIDNLPSTIRRIHIGQNFSKPINYLPDGVKRIKFFHLGEFNHPLDFLPSGLEYLELPNGFNHPLNNLPCSLKYLKIGNKFNYDLNSLPDSIEKLVLPSNYKKEIKRFPKNLKMISICNEYEFPIPEHIEKRKRIYVKFYKKFTIYNF